MENLPKIDEFKTPNGYFDQLEGRIMEKESKQSILPLWTKYAAAAVILISIGTWIFNQDTLETDPFLALEPDVNLYIEADYWEAEDILSLSEDPDLILEEMLEEESYLDGVDLEEEFLF